MKFNKGQSAIEYILLATCVIAVLIVFLAPNGKMFTTISSGINETVDQIGEMAESTNFLCAVISDPAAPPPPPPPPPPVNCSNFHNVTTCTAHLNDCMWRTNYGTSCNPQTPYCTAKNLSLCDAYDPDTGLCCQVHAGCPPCAL